MMMMILETVLDRAKVTITNWQSCIPFQLVPKSTPVDDLERPYRTLLQNDVFLSLLLKFDRR